MEAARVLDPSTEPSPPWGPPVEPVFAPVPPPTLRAVEALATQLGLDPVRTAAQQRRARHAAGLNDLMQRRTDLRGVSLVADHFTDYTRWAV